MTKPRKLVDRLKAIQPPTRETWFTRLGQATKDELLELRREFIASELPGHSIRSLYVFLRQPPSEGGIGLKVGRDAFSDWIREGA